MIYWTDEQSNPLQPGILVTITDPENNVLSGYTVAGGSTPGISEVASTTYTATFYAERGPAGTVTFTTAASGNTTVILAGYRGPYLSLSGAQQLQASVFPKRRAKVGAPNTYAMQMGVAASKAVIDSQIQQIHGAIRLVSSSGSAIDTWAADFLGPNTLPRQPNEPDTSYINRIVQWLMLPFGTLYAIQEVVTSWLNALQVGQLTAPLSTDTAGAADTAGALDGQTLSASAQIVPKALVFDAISNPTLFNELSLNALDAQFVVLFTFPNVAAIQEWSLGQGFLGDTTYLAVPQYYVLSSCPAPALDTLIRIVKAGGTEPIYAANTESA